MKSIWICVLFSKHILYCKTNWQSVEFFEREDICFENKLPVECHLCQIIYNGWNLIPFSTAQSSVRTLWTGLYDEFVSTVVRGGFKLKWRGFENHRKYIRFVVAGSTTFFFSTLCCLFKVFPLVEFYSKGLDEKVFNLSQDAIPASGLLFHTVILEYFNIKE